MVLPFAGKEMLMRKWISALLACTAALLLSQCGGVPPTYYYRIDYPPLPPAKDAAAIPATVAVGPFSADIPYEGDRIVYRHSPYEVQFYHYRRWIAPPPRIVSEMILTQVRSSKLFQRAVPASERSAADYVLKGHITAFEEWDEHNAWFGNVRITFQLYKTGSDEVLWQNEYGVRTPSAARDPLEVVKAISASLNQVVEQAVADISRKLRG